jgi:CRISPR-associated exonuclease Cas4
MTSFLLVGAIVLLLLAGAVLLWLGRRLRADSGLPAGEVIYSDTGAEEAVEAPLISRRYGLVGKPDYLVHTQDGGRRVVVPLEVKKRSRPASEQQHLGHVLQLAAYCMLVEEVHGVTPPYGLLRYADGTLRIPFTEELRGEVLAAAEAIRRARAAPDVHRQHEEPGRCVWCGYRHACGGEALVKGAPGSPQG